MNTRTFHITIAKHGRQLVQVKDFRFEENRITFLFGESGIGKSLLAKAIYGLLDPDEFHVMINGESYKQYLSQQHVLEIQKNSFFVFQEPSSHLDPLLTLGAQIKGGNPAQKNTLNMILGTLWDTEKQDIVQKILTVYPKPYRPSGGEKQRLLLAMAFLKIEQMFEIQNIHAPTFFVFDEPTGSLDNRFRDIFLSFLFEKYQRRNMTVLFITHDYSMISSVRNTQHEIQGKIAYQEMSLGQKGVILNDFQPDHYLNWLANQKHQIVPTGLNLKFAPLLKVESGLEIYGRKLLISKDPMGAVECPLEIRPSTISYLKAPSGMGKTTFVKSVFGLLKTKKLSVTLREHTLTEHTPKRFWQSQIWGRQMAITFQHADEALNQNSTVEGTFSGLPLKKMARENILQRMLELFGNTLDAKFLKKKVRYLSGGQKQKLNLLRSLILDTEILILDEPFNGLDYESIKMISSLLREKQKSGKGILVISHNEEIFDAMIPEENVYHLQALALDHNPLKPSAASGGSL